MTREEAKNQANYKILDKVKLIDRIYDEFDEQLQEAQDRVDSFCKLNDIVIESFIKLQSRTCENCKWLEVQKDGHTWCMGLYTDRVGFNGDMGGFGCNKWKEI